MRIDWWTLALQTVNVLVLVWLLSRFLFKPVVKIVAQRQQEAGRMIAEAATARAQIEEARADAERMRGEVAAERQRLTGEAKAAAQAEGARQLAQVAEELASMRADAEAMIARERADAGRVLMERASELAVEIAQRLLARLPPATATTVLVDEVCARIASLSADERAALARCGGAGEALEIRMASPLLAEQKQRVHEVLAAALGVEVPIEFREDRELIAGVELRGRHLIICNSWRDDLRRIRGELDRDTNGHIEFLAGTGQSDGRVDAARA
jgi:F-type H+-transporting ATPase subunit b